MYILPQKKRLKTILFISGILLLTAGNSKTIAQLPAFIEFGWDYPDVDQLSKRLDSMQNSPFNGICFSLQRTIMEAFDTSQKKPAYFELEKLKKLKWGRYKSNYIIVRGFSKTGGNWFDDEAWITITGNMKQLSKAMLTGNIKGILFDPEYYYENKLHNPWTYSKAQYPTQSFEEIQEQVSKRGTQFIGALQKYKKDLSFISIWLASLIAQEKKYTPFDGTRHALLLSFIEGILLGKNKTVKIIDGNEYAYWNYKPSQFLESTDFLKKNTVEMMKTSKAKQAVAGIEIAQPIFYDGLLAKAPSFEKGIDSKVKWKWMEENLKFAIATSTSTLWFYSERLNWWNNKVNDTLTNILQQAGLVFETSTHTGKKKPSTRALFQQKSDNVNKEKGYFYFADEKTPMQTGSEAFTFKWSKQTKELSIRFTGKIPNELTIFVNNSLSKIIQPGNLTERIKLDGFSKGKLAILAKYNDKQEAAAVQVYK